MAQIPNQNYLSKFNPSKSRLILVLIRCNGGACHVLLNQNEVKFEAKKISFNVIIFEPTPKNPIYKVYEWVEYVVQPLRIQFFSGLARCSCKWCRLGLNGWWRFAMQDCLGTLGSE